jgi:hypothetical protein
MLSAAAPLDEISLHQVDHPLRFARWLEQQGWRLQPLASSSVSDEVLRERLRVPLERGWWLNPLDEVPVWAVRAAGAPDVTEARRVAQAVARTCGSATVVSLREGGARAALAVVDGTRATWTWAGDLSALAAADREVWRVFAETQDSATLALRLARTLERRDVSRRFFRDVRQQLERLTAAWTGVPVDDVAARSALSLSLLCRLMFLYFIQRKGWLKNDERFVARLLLDPRGRGLLRERLQPLFADALNTPERDRPDRRRHEGIPFLHGGLFAPSPTERLFADASLPDGVIRSMVRDLFEVYRFVESEHDSERAAIDPAMLGVVFEELMAAEDRSRSGTFYTPPALVRRMLLDTLDRWLAELLGAAGAARWMAAVRGQDSPGDDRAEAERLLEALQRLRVLDPACGSGAFLLEAADLLARLRLLATRVAGRDTDRARCLAGVVRDNLHGIDISLTAVALAELRLWLAIAASLPDGGPERVEPLPNLSHRIRHGNALHEHAPGARSDAPRTLELAAELRGLAARLGRTHGPGKARLEQELQDVERLIALSHLEVVAARLRSDLVALDCDAASPDLFGRHGVEPPEAAARRSRARAELDRVEEQIRRARRGDWAPVFDARVAFADAMSAGGFDWVIGNPPWVRLADVPPAERQRLREQFALMRPHRSRIDEPGLVLDGEARPAGPFGSQPDLSVAFVERALQLTRPGGWVSLLVPSKLFRAEYGRALRAELTRRHHLAAVRDLSEDTTLHFGADAYPGVILARAAGTPATETEVELAPHRPFVVAVSLLAGATPGAGEPWTLLPPAAHDLLTHIRAAGPPLFSVSTPHMGIKTGANDLFVDIEPEVGAPWQRPVLLGRDVGALCASPAHRLLFAHDAEQGTVVREPGESVREWCERHRVALSARTDARPSDPPWKLFRVRPELLGHRVVWADISRELEAAPLPPAAEGGALVLNTAYACAVDDAHAAHRLAVWLNTRVIRFVARSAADRALGGYRRYTARAVAGLPVPAELFAPRGRLARRYADLSDQMSPASGDEAWDELNAAAARWLDLTPSEYALLRRWSETSP